MEDNLPILEETQAIWGNEGERSGQSQSEEDAGNTGIGVMRYRAGSAGGELQIEGRKEGWNVVSCTVSSPQTA
jgi:hypothetical protein